MRRGVAFAAAASAASPLSRAPLSPWLSLRRRFSERSTPREIFGLEKGEALDAAVLKKRYKKLAKEWHPDRAGGDSNRMSMVNAAFDALSNEEEYGVDDVADEPAPRRQQQQQQPRQAPPRRASHPQHEVRLRPWLHRILSSLDSLCAAVLGRWWPGWRIEAEGGHEGGGGDGDSRREWARQRRTGGGGGGGTAAEAAASAEQLQRRHAEEDREHQRWMRARAREAQREQLLKEMREGQRGHQARAAARTVEIKEDMLVEGDELVAELAVGRPVWLWHGRERASVDTVSSGVRKLRQQKHELHRDRHHGHPLCEKRLSWYAAEMDKAADATPPNARRLAVLVDVLQTRLGDIGDISRFERHGIGAGAS